MAIARVLLRKQFVANLADRLATRIGLPSLFLIAVASPAYAGELQLHLGGLHASPHSEPTYSWALEYRHPLADKVSASFGWQNEGHVPGHHRDGHTVQLWLHTAPAQRRPAFAIGLGPYRYFDTRDARNTDGYINAHGWGFVASAEATWALRGNWQASLRLNRTQVHDSMKTTALVAGIGYRLGPPASGSSGNADAGSAWPAGRRMELDAMLGGTIVNSFDSDALLAKAISLRMRASEHLTGSISYFDEGRVQPRWRAGIAPQVWVEQDLGERLSVSAGVGPYFATRNPGRTDGGSAPTTSLLVSFSAAYALSPSWLARLTWNRVGTRYDRDTDVVMLGVGYRF
jgi:hypothetical protein